MALWSPPRKRRGITKAIASHIPRENRRVRVDISALQRHTVSSLAVPLANEGLNSPTTSLATIKSDLNLASPHSLHIPPSHPTFKPDNPHYSPSHSRTAPLAQEQTSFPQEKHHTTNTPSPQDGFTGAPLAEPVALLLAVQGLLGGGVERLGEVGGVEFVGVGEVGGEFPA
ncbi:hypothetical protein KC338_g73 [Hortaea werneckii]|nr:hypothetical protein KC338_g73 [Hortaea werneckii]